MLLLATGRRAEREAVLCKALRSQGRDAPKSRQ